MSKIVAPRRHPIESGFTGPDWAEHARYYAQAFGPQGEPGPFQFGRTEREALLALAALKSQVSPRLRRLARRKAGRIRYGREEGARESLFFCLNRAGAARRLGRLESVRHLIQCARHNRIVAQAAARHRAQAPALVPPARLNGYPVERAQVHPNCITVLVRRDDEPALPYVVATWWPALGRSWSWGHYVTGREKGATFAEIAERNATR